MTQQYLIGELSVILGEVQAVVENPSLARDVASLRQEAETGPPEGLASIAVRALELTDSACWDSLTEGDSGDFIRQAAVCAELWEFAACI